MKLLSVHINDQSTIYRHLFRSAGLTTVQAAAHVFRTVQSNLRRAHKQDDSDPTNWGFEVEGMYEGDADCNELPLGRLILGDKDVAFFDADGYNVFVAEREADVVLVYNVRDLFLYLLDEGRVRMAAVVAPTGATTPTKAAGQCATALAALLGFGYNITPNGEQIAVMRRDGSTLILDTVKTAGLLQHLLGSADAKNPEYVFKALAAAESAPTVQA